VYKAMLKGLQSVGTDAASGGTDQKTANPGLKHSCKTQIYLPEGLTFKCLSKNGRDRRIDVPDRHFNVDNCLLHRILARTAAAPLVRSGTDLN